MAGARETNKLTVRHIRKNVWLISTRRFCIIYSLSINYLHASETDGQTEERAASGGVGGRLHANLFKGQGQFGVAARVLRKQEPVFQGREAIQTEVL
jgi:hypothetical protein